MVPPEPNPEAENCRKSFSHFVKEFWEQVPGSGNLVWNWHLDVICDELQEVATRVFNNEPRTHDLILNVPFGTSKSTLTSILFPAWVWSNMPSARFICASHTDKLVNDLSSKCRAVITSEKYKAFFPGINLIKDTESYFRNVHGGDRNTCTVGGKTPTGFHAHFILVDDPIDPQGARSEVELETASKFMTEVIPSRVVDKLISVTILIMQRLHHRDPTKVMKDVAAKADSVPVRQITLPGELTDDVNPPELRKHYVDGLMDIRRLPWPVLKAYRARLGEYGYAGQVLQNPIPPGGGMFKRDYFSRRVKAAPWNCQRIIYWDRAATQDGGCYTAGVLLAKEGENGPYYVEHCVHGQWEPRERNKQIRAEALRCRSRYGPNYEPVIYIEAERGSTGLESFQNIADMLAGFVVKEDHPTGSKDVRAESWSSYCASGALSVVDDGTWDVEGYIEEHCLFRPDFTTAKRLGKFKDQVDGSTGAFNLLANTKTLKPMRTWHFGAGNKPKHLLILVCKTADLPTAIMELRTLLVVIQDPKPSEGVVCNGREMSGIQRTNGGTPEQEINSSASNVNRAGQGTIEAVFVTEKPTDPDLPSRTEDPKPGEGVMSNGLPLPSEHYKRGMSDSWQSGVDVNGAGQGIIQGSTVNGKPHDVPDLPSHSISKLTDSLTLRFADIEPENLQEQWETILPEFNAKPADVIITQEQGKKLWSFLLKKRPEATEAIVFVSPNARRAFSVAKVVCQQFRLPDPSIMNADVEPTPNKHLMEMVKRTRNMVIG